MTDETTNPIRDASQTAIDDHEVILFMKGTPDAPACGFSARTVGALQALGAPFAAVDILPDPRIREELSAISEWPPMPRAPRRWASRTGSTDVHQQHRGSGQAQRRVAVGPEPVAAGRLRRLT